MNQQFTLPRLMRRERMIERVSATLKGLSQDRAWRVSVAEHKPTRSDQQNRYLWGCVYPSILKAGGETLAGWTTDELHEYLLGEHFGWEIISGFGVRRRRPIRRSSRLNKQEFSDYIEFIQRRMAEHGIYVPSANEVAA
jgi:hypothetical protein